MGALLICGVIGGVLYAFASWKSEPKGRALLREASPCEIARVEDQQHAKVIGTVKRSKTTPIIAPLSGRECVYYHVTVDVSIDNHWQQIISDEDGCPFDIVDQSGRATIPCEHVNVFLRKDYKVSSGFFDNPTSEELALLQKHRQDDKTIFGFNKAMRYREGVIEIGEKVTVMGKGSLHPDPNPMHGPSHQAYRGKVATYVKFEGSPSNPVFISDEALVIGPGGESLAKIEN